MKGNRVARYDKHLGKGRACFDVVCWVVSGTDHSVAGHASKRGRVSQNGRVNRSDLLNYSATYLDNVASLLIQGRDGDENLGLPGDC